MTNGKMYQGKPGEGGPVINAIGSLFEETAEDYAKLFLPGRSAAHFGLMKRMALAAEMVSGMSGNLLDCAAGTGEIAGAVLATGRFRSATIVDLSPRMLEMSMRHILENHARDVTADVEYVNGDIFRFVSEHQDRKYDLVLCLGLIAHTGRAVELLRSLRCFLPEGGAIMLQTTLLDHMGTRILRTLTRRRYSRRHGYDISYYREKDIAGICRETGLRIVEERRFGVGIPFGDRVWPWGSYQAELLFERWAEKHGAEAVFVLKRTEDA